MSQNKEETIIIDENNKVKNTYENDSKSEEVENLIKEIYYLRAAIYKYEYDLKPAKFSDIAESLPKCTLSSACRKAYRVPDVPTILRTELYKYGGINCVQVGDEFVFQFPVVINEKETLYSVQIVNNNGRGDLGKWVMPESVDMTEIVKEHPLDDINNTRNFIKTCKHYIDCYTYRQQQFYELKDYISDSKNCSLETNMEYIRIVLQMLGIKMISTGQVYDIVLYIFYKPNEAMPCQMKMETSRDEDELDRDTKKMLQKYFRYFKKHSLKSAFEKIETNTSVFELKKIPKEEINVVDVEDEDDQLAVEFLKIVRKQNGGKIKDRSRDISREKDFPDEDAEFGDESEQGHRSQGVSNRRVEPKRNKTIDKRNIEKEKSDKAKGIPTKTTANAERKRKSLGEKQQTLNFTKTTKATQDITHQTVSNRRQTIHVSKNVTDATRETNNNTPIKKFSHLSKRSEDFAKAPQVLRKSVAMENDTSAIVGRPTTTANTSQKKSNKFGNKFHELRKSLNIVKNPNNPSVEESKKRKSVRWQVDPIERTNRQLVCQNTAEESNTLVNSTPLSGTLSTCRNNRPSFDHISEILKNVKTQSDVLMANNEREDAEEKSAASHSGESENAEDQATLLRDLQLIKEMKGTDIKSKKKVQVNNQKSLGKKSNKDKK